MGLQITDPPAVVETRVVHRAHRRATALLADAIPSSEVPRDAVTELRDLVVAMLRHHHEAEDEDLWPLLTRSAPALVEPLAALSVEHEQLDDALDRLEVSLSASTATELRTFVHAHLDHEEPILFPALREHVTASEWEGFSARTVASTPPVGTHLFVALLHEVATDEEVGLILRHLPRDAVALVPTMRAQAAPTLLSLQAPVGAAGSTRET